VPAVRSAHAATEPAPASVEPTSLVPLRLAAGGPLRTLGQRPHSRSVAQMFGKSSGASKNHSGVAAAAIVTAALYGLVKIREAKRPWKARSPKPHRHP
jgi:hypothetical protein